MTVVARGAAIYAAGVELAQPPAGAKAAPGAVSLKLAYEPVSASTETQVAGKISGANQPLEVRIDAQAGYWTSGWLPVTNNYFEVNTSLQAGKICPFYIYVRDKSGQPLDVQPNEFTIRHGLELSAPPLPHTISVEVVRPNGRVELDPIFPRNTPLPTEKRIQYRARHTLRPGQVGAPLVVKLWEGEEVTEPEANDWVGNVQISPAMVRRAIPENSELELFIRIDASRLITVEIFVPHLNQHFSEGIYLAEHEQRSDSTAAATLNKDIVAFTDRLAALQAHLAENPNADAEMVLKNLQHSVQDLDIEVAVTAQQQALGDPDRARRLVAEARNLRSQVAALERKVGLDRIFADGTRQAKKTINDVQETIERYGDTVDRYEFDLARKDLEQAAERLDERAVRRSVEKLMMLHFSILGKQDWWWRDAFESMDKSDAAFRNPDAARHWVAECERAIREGKGGALREAMRQLWNLQTRSAADEAKQRAAESGLKS